MGTADVRDGVVADEHGPLRRNAESIAHGVKWCQRRFPAGPVFFGIQNDVDEWRQRERVDLATLH